MIEDGKSSDEDLHDPFDVEDEEVKETTFDSPKNIVK
jgi:hypothetical protein